VSHNFYKIKQLKTIYKIKKSINYIKDQQKISYFAKNLLLCSIISFTKYIYKLDYILKQK